MADGAVTDPQALAQQDIGQTPQPYVQPEGESPLVTLARSLSPPMNLFGAQPDEASPTAPAGPPVPMKGPDGRISLVPADQANDQQINGLVPATPEEFNHQQAMDKYGGPGSELAGFAEQTAGAATADLSKVLEQTFGVSPLDIAGRAEAIGPGARFVAAALGFGLGSAATGGFGTEALLGAGVGRFAAGAASLGTYEAGHQLSDHVLGDPNQTAESVIAHVGLSALLGGTVESALGLMARDVPPEVKDAGKAFGRWGTMGSDVAFNAAAKVAEATPDQVKELWARMPDLGPGGYTDLYSQEIAAGKEPVDAFINVTKANLKDAQAQAEAAAAKFETDTTAGLKPSIDALQAAKANVAQATDVLNAAKRPEVKAAFDSQISDEAGAVAKNYTAAYKAWDAVERAARARQIGEMQSSMAGESANQAIDEATKSLGNWNLEINGDLSPVGDFVQAQVDAYSAALEAAKGDKAAIEALKPQGLQADALSGAFKAVDEKPDPLAYSRLSNLLRAQGQDTLAAGIESAVRASPEQGRHFALLDKIQGELSLAVSRIDGITSGVLRGDSEDVASAKFRTWQEMNGLRGRIQDRAGFTSDPANISPANADTVNYVKGLSREVGNFTKDDQVFGDVAQRWSRWQDVDSAALGAADRSPLGKDDILDPDKAEKILTKIFKSGDVREGRAVDAHVAAMHDGYGEAVRLFNSAPAPAEVGDLQSALDEMQSHREAFKGAQEAKETAQETVGSQAQAVRVAKAQRDALALQAKAAEQGANDAIRAKYEALAATKKATAADAKEAEAWRPVFAKLATEHPQEMLDVAKRLGAGKNIGLGGAGLAGWVGSMFGVPYPIAAGGYLAARNVGRTAAVMETFGKVLRIKNSMDGAISAGARGAAKALTGIGYATRSAPGAALYDAMDSNFRKSLLGGVAAKSVLSASRQHHQELAQVGGPEDQGARLGGSVTSLPPSLQQPVVMRAAAHVALRKSINPQEAPHIGGFDPPASEADASNHARMLWLLDNPLRLTWLVEHGMLTPADVAMSKAGNPLLHAAQVAAIHDELSQRDASKMGPHATAQMNVLNEKDPYPPGFVEANQLAYATPNAPSQAQAPQDKDGRRGTATITGSRVSKTRKFENTFTPKMPNDTAWKPS